MNGLFYQFKLLFDHMLNVIIKRLFKVNISVKLAIENQDVSKIKQCGNMVQRIKDELFQPFMDQIMGVQETSQNEKEKHLKQEEEEEKVYVNKQTREKFGKFTMWTKETVVSFWVSVKTPE